MNRPEQAIIDLRRRIKQVARRYIAIETRPDWPHATGTPEYFLLQFERRTLSGSVQLRYICHGRVHLSKHPRHLRPGHDRYTAYRYLEEMETIAASQRLAIGQD